MKPSLGGEKRRQSRKRRIDQFLNPSLRYSTQFSNGNSQEVKSKRDCFTMEIPTVKDLLLFSKDERVVRGGVDFGLKGFSNMGKGIPHGPMNLGNTTEGLGILNL
jgi:hypothetical protein